jgi:ABC-type Mn2+/Zn2+ transport system permease subunit
MQLNILIFILVSCFVGAAAGYLGSFMVLKKMSLVGDALSHVALPGMAIAILFNFSPMIGAFAALVLAVIGVWYFESKSTVYPDALVGVFFTFSLALGVLITPEPELLEALFGSIEKITPIEAVMAVVLSLTVIFVTKFISKKMVLGSISKELLESLGKSYQKTNLVYLLLVGLIVALGVRFVGTMLMGALVVVPAASAKNVSKSMNSYFILSALFGILSSFAGSLLGNVLRLSTGPCVVLVSIAIFVVTYLLRSADNKS